MSLDDKDEKKPREDGRTEAFYAVQKDKTGRCEDLLECLESGVDPNAVDIHGDTALHWACWNLRPRPMEILLEHGALPNFQNHKGHTPLHHVINRERNNDTYEMATRLLDGGADASLPDKKGWTAYHALMQRSRLLRPHESIGLAQLLSEKGGTDGWFVEDEDGLTPLDIGRQNNDQNLAIFVAALQASLLEKATPEISPRQPNGRRL